MYNAAIDSNMLMYKGALAVSCNATIDVVLYIFIQTKIPTCPLCGQSVKIVHGQSANDQVSNTLLLFTDKLEMGYITNTCCH